MTPAERVLLLAVAHAVLLGNPNINALIEAVGKKPAKPKAPAPRKKK